MLKSLGLRFLGTGKYTEAGITSGKPASDENITFHCHKSTPDISTADMCYWGILTHIYSLEEKKNNTDAISEEKLILCTKWENGTVP